MYPPELVKPMREDLTRVGFSELHTANEVEEALKKEGTTLVVVNSVCGCAAANARPGAAMSLDNSKKPDNLVTVFAGVDREAVDAARANMVSVSTKLTFYGVILEMVNWCICSSVTTLKAALHK